LSGTYGGVVYTRRGTSSVSGRLSSSLRFPCFQGRRTGDLDGDGCPDIARQTRWVSIILHTMTVFTVQPIAPSNVTSDVTIVDLDGDGDPDLQSRTKTKSRSMASTRRTLSHCATVRDRSLQNHRRRSRRQRSA
jgi:hypothetical protein